MKKNCRTHFTEFDRLQVLPPKQKQNSSSDTELDGEIEMGEVPSYARTWLTTKKDMEGKK